MKKIIFATIFLSFSIVSKSRAELPADSVNISAFGKVHIYNRTKTPANVVIMISGDGGWKFGVIGFAESFSEMNTLVIGVDILRYYRNLKQSSDSCYNVAADFVKLATEIEKRYGFPEYTPPVIMGYSSGATLVYGILAQARPGTFPGGISLGFCPDIELPKMLCQFNGLKVKVDVPGKRYLLQPDAKLGNPWIVLHGKLDKECNYSEVADFVKKTNDAELITLTNVGHGFTKFNDFMPQWKNAYTRLIEQHEKFLQANSNNDEVKNLPLSITNAKFQNKEAPFAILISGDGGWYGFEQNISDHLAMQGIPTVGLDAKKYFWNRRSPEETAGDVARIVNYFSKEWEKDRFLLIGYSLGAEIVPFIVNRLPDAIKSKLVSDVLLSPATSTDFEIHISNMLGMGNRQNSYNVTQEIISIQSVPTLIILGEGEKSPVPGLLKGTSVKIRIIPGDHHYKFNLPLIVQIMKDNKAF